MKNKNFNSAYSLAYTKHASPSIEKNKPRNILLEYEYSNSKLMPWMITKNIRNAIGRHLVNKQSFVDADSYGYNTKNTATDLKNGTSFGPVFLILVIAKQLN